MARAVCKQTQLEFQPLGLAYDANVHGWRASSFHTQLDGQGAAILVATAADGTVIGRKEENSANTGGESGGESARP